MLRIETLGKTRVFVDADEQRGLLAQPIRCALVVFFAAEQTVTKDKLLGMFWPEQDERSARHALNQHVYGLRKMLGDDTISSHGDELSLNTPYQFDVRVFEEAIARSDYRIALEVYRGSFLQAGPVVNVKGFEDWVEQRRFKLRRAWIRAAQAYVQQLVAAGEAPRAIQIARQVVELEPQEDELQHQLIRLLFETGQRNEALEQYDLYERALREDELEPLDDTKALVDQFKAIAVLPSREGAAAPGVAAEVVTPKSGSSNVIHTIPDAGETRVATWTTRRRGLLALAGLLLVLVSAYLIVRRIEGGPEPAPQTVAMFYLDSPSNDAPLQETATALTEEVIANLRTLPGAMLLPKDAVVQFRGKPIPTDIGTQLAADLMVTGTLTRSRSQVHARLALIDGKTRTLIQALPTVELSVPMDSQAYSRLLTDVTISLRSALGREITMRRRRQETRNSQAWQMYARADTLFENAVPLIQSGGAPAAMKSLQDADSMLARASELDDEWAAPLLRRSAIAERRAIIAEFFLRQKDGARLWYDSAVKYASWALERKPDDPEALETRGMMRARVWERLVLANGEGAEKYFQSAEEDLQRAVAADEHRAAAWVWLARLHHARADYRNEKIALLNARASDAFAAELHHILYALSLASFELGQDRDAQTWCDEGRRRFPGDQEFLYCQMVLLAWADSIPADTARAFSLLQQLQNWPGAIQPHQARQFSLLTAATALRAGHLERGSTILERASQPGEVSKSTVIEAAVRAAAGQNSNAIGLLERYSQSYPLLSSSELRSRMFHRLRGDPRFAMLLGRYPPAFVDR
ncbi:MAG TPA: BTAD domain-containing putative transcriptional regulator [Longimicrobiales bacterium]|nr:BTAD domain-containing putative transcriptional regulator [Longimicrobiales bacterium]